MCGKEIPCFEEASQKVIICGIYSVAITCSCMKIPAVNFQVYDGWLSFVFCFCRRKSMQQWLSFWNWKLTIKPWQEKILPVAVQKARKTKRKRLGIKLKRKMLNLQQSRRRWQKLLKWRMEKGKVRWKKWPGVILVLRLGSDAVLFMSRT